MTMASLHPNNIHLKAKWVQQFKQNDMNILCSVFKVKYLKEIVVLLFCHCVSSFSTFTLFGFQDLGLILGAGLKSKLHNCRYQIGLKLFSVPCRHKIYGKLF